jgi:hypothetical protein
VAEITSQALSLIQGDQKIRKKLPNFSKIAQKSPSQKMAKIATTKLNLKAKNIYNNTLLKP